MAKLTPLAAWSGRLITVLFCAQHTLWPFTKILDATQIACIRSSLGMKFRNEKHLERAGLR
jgi:hypothetical protein